MILNHIEGVEMKENEENKKIFDLKNLDDLDELTRKVIESTKAKRLTLSNKILHLFEIKEQLRFDEILVGLWRKYKTKTTYKSLKTNLTVMKANGDIRRIKKGAYERGNNYNEEELK